MEKILSDTKMPLCERLQAGDKVVCTKCGKGTFEPHEGYRMNVARCPCFTCNNCGCHVNIDIGIDMDF